MVLQLRGDSVKAKKIKYFNLTVKQVLQLFNEILKENNNPQKWITSNYGPVKIWKISKRPKQMLANIYTNKQNNS